MKSNTRFIPGLAMFAVLTIGTLSLSAQRPQYAPPGTFPISGTYELESTRGGDPRQTASAATRSLPPGLRDRAFQSLLSRLEPPRLLAIDRNGRTITIESSRGPRSVFEADGRTQVERDANGRVTTTRGEIMGNQVRFSTGGGSRGSDFSVTFESLNYGSALRVTRRLDDDDLPRPVTIQSYYQRSAPLARWGIYAGGPGRSSGRGNDDRNGSGSFGWPAMAVPDGMQLLALLDTPLSMRTSRHGEQFTMTVREPAEFRGARLTGVVTRVNGTRNGATDLRVDFETIELRGRSADFDGYVNTIRLSDRAVLHLNEDGDPRDANRNNVVRNGAIGAAVGAIIGAVAGGGKGAAIGALIGGTGGVILSQGHEQLELPRGTEVTLTSVTPQRGR